MRKVCDLIDGLDKAIGPLLAACETGAGQEILACQSLADLEKQGVTKETIEHLYQWCHENYKSGQYQRAIPGLQLYESLLTKVLEPELKQQGPSAEENDVAQLFQRSLSVKWGLLAAHIQALQWQDAASQAVRLDLFLDEFVSDRTGMSKKEILNQRTFLMHWILFILFKQQPCEGKIIELFMSENTSR
jgi:hypothetical protein